MHQQSTSAPEIVCDAARDARAMRARIAGLETERAMLADLIDALDEYRAAVADRLLDIAPLLSRARVAAARLESLAERSPKQHTIMRTAA